MGPWGRFVEGIAKGLAFFPPSPPSYEIKEHQDGTGELYIEPTDRRHAKVVSAKVARVATAPLPGGRGGGGTEIIVAFVPHMDSRGRRARCTLLCSHGNAVDLGQMLPVYRDLGRLLRANVAGYDYSGYGRSSGEVGVAATLADIKAAMAHVVDAHGVALGDVVLYGTSVGSGPTCWLAAQDPGVAGVVLHAPLLSGVRVLNPGLSRWPAWADVYPNHTLAPRIAAPLLVLHGTADAVVHVSHGQRLAELAPAAVEPLWAEGRGHDDVEASPLYIPRLRAFLAQLFPGDYSAAAA